MKSPERTLARSLALPLLVLASAVAIAEDEPLALLGEMARNLRTVNYQGVFTYEQGQTLSSSRIVHSVASGLERERLEQLDGPRREYLRLDHPLDCRHADDWLVAAADGRPLLQLGEEYVVELEGTERVASREGKRLRVSPRDPYRYGRVLVLDAETGLPLRSETTDEAGRVLERFQFVDLRVGGDIAAAEMLTAEPGSRIEAAHHHRPTADAEHFDWDVSWLPKGFALSAQESRNTADAGEVQTRMYSDGLASFTVFVERGAATIAQPGVATQGATVAFVTSRGPGELVTVVGAIPIDTAQLIANSVNLRAEAR